MIILNPNKYDLAVPQLMDVKINNLFARAVIEQKVDGKVYVDDDKNPRSFYVAHPYGMSLFFEARATRFYMINSKITSWEQTA